MLRVSIIFPIIITIVYYPSCIDAQCKRPEATGNFVDSIFDRFGSAGDNGLTVINATGLNKLLKALSLSKLNVVCEEGDLECKKDKLHVGVEITDPLLSRKRRAIPTPNEHAKTIKQQRKTCDKIKTTIKSSFGLKPTTVINKTDFVNVCPFLVDQVSTKACEHYHKRYPAFVPPELPPSSAEKWGYGVIAITICSALSLSVIVMIPCLKKSFYDKVMAFLVALAVGTLCGDALLHLIPHAFIEGANNAAGIEVSEEQEELQHKSQVYRALIVMVGIYLFFIVEQLMKLKGSCAKNKEHSHHSNDEQMVDKAGGEEEKEHHNHQEDVLVETGGHSHAPSGHSHSHGDKNITGETNISTVAWMVVVGDGFHNFSDGLAVGAAFSASLSSGVSTTIAIFCHELPHELGDFAVLLKAGMTVKQAIVYNLVGAVLSYVGLAIGILAGTNELGRHVILCLTAGLFLYISLVNMMTEVANVEASIDKCGTVICQHLGMLTGIVIMLVISLYE